ncbi:MAG: hypothetical protein ACXVH1_21540 [Solirubrobacteraceae bacterium]
MTFRRVAWLSTATLAMGIGVLAMQPRSAGAMVRSEAAPAAEQLGPAGFTMEQPISSAVSPPGPVASGAAPINASYAHTPAPNSGNDLPAGSGPVMPSTTIYYVFWLPTGQHYESNAAGDTNYENLLVRWAKDLGSSQYHNLVTQYSGTNGAITNAVTYGGSWTDTAAYPHAGTTGDPLQDGDIQTEVTNAVAANGWTEDLNHIVAVFTANGIQECQGSSCTFSSSNGFCAYHDHFTDGGNDAVYAFMGFDNFTHVAGKTCVAGQTGGDTDPNRGVYPNGDVSADAEVNTLSHEVIEAETDPHPNATWTGPNGEIGDACNFNFAPRNDLGADVYINGHPYIVQQEWSNAAHTCAIDLPTNGFCAGSASKVCSPTTTFSKTVDNSAPRVTSTIHYTVTLNNTNDTGAETNSTVTDNAPLGYTITSISAPGSTASSFTASSFTVGYDTLPVHQSRTVTVTATVPLQAGTTATNCATLSGSDLLGTALSDQTSSPCADTTPVKIPTIVTYGGATSGDYNDPATVSATLTDDSLNPLSGKTLHFTLNGIETCSGVTDGSGTASCQITPGELAGPYALAATFSDTSDPTYSTTTTSTPFTVTLEESTTAYTGPTVILQGASGATLTGRLLEDGTTPIAGRTLTLGVGSQTCTGVTNVGGNASCTVTFTGPLGSEPLSASFTSDGYYKSSSDTSKTAIVFAFPSRGAFTLGDTTAATAGTGTVTWWNASWSKDNVLSGGGAPAAFKGFAATITLPTASPPTGCPVSAFTTGPGNSSSPPGSVPSYMGVVVTSSVTKSGSTISGNSAHIVVVKVNPGYGPDPGSPGTGTIVATYC